jgi:hypothetical protein
MLRLNLIIWSARRPAPAAVNKFRALGVEAVFVNQRSVSNTSPFPSILLGGYDALAGVP